MSFKLTYSTMFDPPEEMHSNFENALGEVRANLGGTYAMYIDGQDVAAERTAENRSPVDQRVVLGHFPVGNAEDVERAMAAAKTGPMASSGSMSATTSPAATARGRVSTAKPSARARDPLGEPARAPTRTTTPLRRRL